MSEKKDLFDRIMSLSAFRPLYPFYRRHKEILLYLLFGGLAMVVSISVYWLCSEPLGMHVLLANITSWVAAVTFAYVTNRLWVFSQKAVGLTALLAEILRFFSGRVATLVVEEIILWLFIERFHFSSMAVKIVAQVIVVLLNYIISKFLVFRKNAEDRKKQG